MVPVAMRGSEEIRVSNRDGRLDRVKDSVGESPCPECRGIMPIYEQYPDGSRIYIAGRACSTCHNRRSDGKGIAFLEINMGGPVLARADGDTEEE